MYVVETHNISYQQDKKKILDEINLKIPKGSIYGFIGPNGAGKSTTIKAILGLIPSLSPAVFILEKKLSENFSILKNIGSLIERPSIYEHLNAYDNLRIYQLLFQVSKDRIMDVLDLVSLKNEAYLKVKSFSLGMKQRLGIAIALLNDPEVVLLDEPTNGIDPDGIKDFKLLINSLHTQNKTIIISSHQLAELETLVTDIGIIQHGQLIFQGTIEKLRNSGKLNLKLKVDNVGQLKSLLELKGLNYTIDENQGFHFENLNEKSNKELILSILNENITILFLSRTKSLEDFYFETTHGNFT